MRIRNLDIALVVLVAWRNKLEFLIALVPQLLKILGETTPGEVHRVGEQHASIEMSSRKRPQWAVFMNSQAVAFVVFSFLFSGSIGAQAPSVGELFSSARPAVPLKLSDSELRSVLQRGLRHPAGNAVAVVAVVIPRPEASLVLVFIRQPDGIFLATDASGVESGNFGKLGRPRTDYERYETEPIEWRQRDDAPLQVVIRTRAWRMGQRYTVAEPLLIEADGTVLYR